MAKVVITVTELGRGIDVQCRLEPEEKDSGDVQKVASAVAVGIAGTVTNIIRNSLKSKGKRNAH
ncbi:hypothetical protein ACCY16_01990 [Candidatus Pantoea formicae]|uniref:hypothetical protein n=1 Tax=Candidatus Pantoea formicae TaxID=2608355 RepID=UPI003ED9F2AE